MKDICKFDLDGAIKEHTVLCMKRAKIFILFVVIFLTIGSQKLQFAELDRGTDI